MAASARAGSGGSAFATARAWPSLHATSAGHGASTSTPLLSPTGHADDSSLSLSGDPLSPARRQWFRWRACVGSAPREPLTQDDAGARNSASGTVR
nr:unnamed protein product [Digitaria exilis]